MVSHHSNPPLFFQRSVLDHAEMGERVLGQTHVTVLPDGKGQLVDSAVCTTLSSFIR